MGKKSSLKVDLLKDIRVLIKAFMHVCVDFDIDKNIDYISKNINTKEVKEIWQEEAEKL